MILLTQRLDRIKDYLVTMIADAALRHRVDGSGESADNDEDQHECRARGHAPF